MGRLWKRRVILRQRQLKNTVLLLPFFFFFLLLLTPTQADAVPCSKADCEAKSFLGAGNKFSQFVHLHLLLQQLKICQSLMEACQFIVICPQKVMNFLNFDWIGMVILTYIFLHYFGTTLTIFIPSEIVLTSLFNHSQTIWIIIN